MSAVRYMLDEEHELLPTEDRDKHQYVLGRLSGHHVVIARLPQGSRGTASAVIVATRLDRIFPLTRYDCSWASGEVCRV